MTTVDTVEHVMWGCTVRDTFAVCEPCGLTTTIDLTTII